jgi:predicted Zn-dependent protease
MEGRAVYFDGQTPQGHEVLIRVSEAALDLSDPAGVAVAEWSKDGLITLTALPGRLRFANRDFPDARLEVSDPDLVAQLLPVVATFRDGSRMSRPAMIRIGLLIAAAVGSVAGVILFGVPTVAAQLAPLVPIGFEASIGEDVRPQIIRVLSHGSAEPCHDPAGLAALKKATAPLIAASGTALPVSVDVVNLSVPNAFALPGGSIIVLDGLLNKVTSQEQFLAVLAHELGHVHNRDAMRQLIETAGLSAVISAVIGDYSGSTMSVLIGQSLIRAGYSRAVEANADAFAVALLARIGRDPGSLGQALEEMTAGLGDPFAFAPWLASHPSTPERIARLKAAALAVHPAPILSPDEWVALKAICR